MPGSSVAVSGSADRAFYASSIDYLSPEKIANFRRHVKEVKVYVTGIAPQLQSLDGKKGPLDVLELGAGSCLTTLSIKKLLGRGRFVCADISNARMAALAGGVAELISGDVSGLEFLEHDFTFELPLPDASFDVIVFDAALHHSRNIWTTLRECHRVLRPGGIVAALREAYVSPLTFPITFRRLLASPEFRAGAAENAYLKAQYDYYFRAAGFDPRFMPVFSNLKWKLLAPLNGLVISKYNIWATRREK